MDKFQLKSQFNESTTKVGSQLDYMDKCAWKLMQIWCNKSILIKSSQFNLYCIQITKYTSNI